MLARIYSGTTLGLHSVLVEVEVDIPDQGFPGFAIVGLPGKAVKESCERVRSAIKNAGFKFPNKKITVNLTPANLPKDGALYDLPIALGVLIADKQLPEFVKPPLVFGELSLDGSLRHTNGALPLTLLARDQHLCEVLLPSVNAREAAMVSQIDVLGIQSLHHLTEHLNGQLPIPITPSVSIAVDNQQSATVHPMDMADVKGQEQAKRVLEIAAAGGHNVFMIGSPGSGKTMLARTLPSILPEMNEEEVLELTKIYSIAGKLPPDTAAVMTRPFRSPHHTTSVSGLIGGGSRPMPGEISLAHRGVLFLDEFLEFPRTMLESLRQPLEDGIVTVSRVAGTLQFPAQFVLIAAANPCPCGYLLSKTRHCTCLPGMVDRYQKRISGPIIDRIDLHVSVHEVEIEKLGNTQSGETSQTIRQRVNLARRKQQARYRRHNPKLICNADMNSKDIKILCPLETQAKQLLHSAAEKMNLSARSYFRVIKVARTIADLEAAEDIQVHHLAEALQYRPQLDIK